MMLRYFVLISLALCAHGMKLHRHMTKQEIESTFNCDHKLVHEIEYEVTPVLHVDGLSRLVQEQAVPRAQSAVHLRAFDKDISLYLSENDNLLLGSHTPLFMAQSIPSPQSTYGRWKKRSNTGSEEGSAGSSQIVYSRLPFPMPDGLKLYHDMENRAAVTVFTDDDNQAHVYGTVGDEYVIKPIPKRLHKEVLPMLPEFQQSSFSYQSRDPFSNDPLFRDPFSGNSLKGNFYEPTHHIVMKPKVQVNSPFYDPTTGHWINTQQQSYNSNFGALSNPFNAGNPLFNRPIYHHPAMPQQSSVPRPHLNGQSQFNPITKTPVHLPTYRFPTRKPEPKLPITQRPTFKQSVNPHNTPVRPVKPVEEHSDTVYPELLVSTDYETFEAYGSNLSELSKYMAAFWNAVDLRYREISQPKVRLNIAGLIIPQTRESVPYFEKSRWRSNRTIFLASETLSEVGKYFADGKKFPNITYDIAVAMSHQNLGTLESGGVLNENTSGIANLKGACKLTEGWAAALIRDKGGFNGITTAAHELAHSMGVSHDDEHGLPGGPCAWSDGYLMSYNRRDSKGMHWSQCSKHALRKYLLSPEGECMKNKPNVGKPYSKILPGKMLSRDIQCERSFGAGWFSNKKEESNCAVLHCRKHKSEKLDMLNTENRPPAEGSYCGEGSICLDAQCVKDPTVH